MKNKHYQTIDTLFEQNALRTPNAPALTLNGQTYTYQELNKKANKLAHYLQNIGVKPGISVGLHMPKSLETVVGFLGILKAGGIYIPISPDDPKHRIQAVIEETNPAIILSDNITLQNLKLNTSSPFICLDDYQIDLQPTHNVNRSHTITDTAYIIYTSGTTGKPKGIIIPHSNIINAYFGWEKIYQLKNNIFNHLQMANFNFDVFIGDVTRALCSGAHLVMCPKNILLNPASLYELIENEKIQCAEFVPAVLRKLINYCEASEIILNTMQILICGSDTWTIGEYKKFKGYCNDQARVINSYGVTEATIDSAYFEYSEEDSWMLSDQSLVPIGSPFLNVQLFLLNENLNPVAIGEEGEIYIGGEGLAKEYLNQPQLTAQKFIHIFMDNNLIRLYKTGDKGRLLSNLTIELLGRVDNQIKIKGHRIEINAIEAFINSYFAVDQSIVTVEGETDQQYLVAWIAPKYPEDNILQYNELVTHLKEHLPFYMMPKYYRIVDKLPLTSNGKLDRNNLAQITATNLK